MSLMLNSQGTYINSETGKYKFLINYETSEYLTVDISSGNVITINDKNQVTINTNFDTYSNDFAKLYKVKNNTFCNYLVFVQRNTNIGYEYIIIPLLINEGNIVLPNIESDYSNFFLYKTEKYFGFWLSIAPEIDGTLTSGEFNTACPIGSYGSNIYLIVFQNENEKLFLSINYTSIFSDVAMYIFNGKNLVSNDFKMYYLKTDYSIYDIHNNKINDNGFISFIAPYIVHEKLSAFIYKNYFIILTREENGIHICYAEIEGNNITDFGEITGLDYKGGFLGFSIVDDNYLYLNYSKDSSYSNSVDCYYVLTDSTVVNFKVSYSEENNLPLTSWWALLPHESYTFTQPITKITYKINKNDSIFGKNTIEFVYYSNEEIVIHSYVHFDNDYVPYQFILDKKTYQISDDETLRTINGLNITTDQVINFFVSSYLIRFLDYDGTELETKYVGNGVTPTYTGTAPSREGYTFTGWTPALYPANKNQDYTAVYEKNIYTIRFLDYDGTELETKQVEYGVTPTYTGETPTREGYTFTGRTPTLYPANKNQDYTAVYDEIEPYNITIVDSGGDTENFTVIELDKGLTQVNKIITDLIISNTGLSLHLGVRYKDTIYEEDNYNQIAIIMYKLVSISGFTGFTIDGIIENGVFNQAYSNLNIKNNITISIEAVRNYLIRFLDYDGSVLEQNYYKTGTIPQYSSGEPARIGYTFTGWNPSIETVSKNQDYTATYTIQTFTIRFLDDEGSVLEMKNVNYGEIPTYTGKTPTKEGYTFNGWSPTLYPANKNQDYKATFRNNAFALTLYKNSAENNRIDKTEYLTSVGEITGYLRNETNIINPSIIIEYDKVIDFNYVYISTFNRYYFVTNITSVRTNLWRLDMSCDTLMTYKETILNYECYVSRNENDYNEDIEDKYLPLEYEKEVDYILQQDTTGTNTDFFKGFSALITTLATSPEVNLESENIEITTPFNDLDGEPAKTNIYEAGSSNFKVIQMITDSGAYASCLNAIANALIEDDNKAGYVQSIIVFPIWNPAMYDQIGYKTMTDFYYGSEKLPLGGTYNVVLKGDTIAPIKVAIIYIRPKFNNFLDYDPYTTYEIWLPFHGWVKLPSEQVVGNYLNVYYVINTSSTKGTIIIRQQSDSAVILQVDCTIGVEIPISTTNGEDIKRRQTSDAINLAVQGVGGVLMGAVGVVTGNPLLAFGGAMMATGAITGGISSSMTNRVEAQGKVSDGNAGLYSDRVVKIRRTSSIVAVDDISKYAKYIGRPLQTNVKLNTLTGYTIVGGVHIENLDTATDNEKTDIENQLRKGVII